jgi:hypothetical protein
MLRLLARDALLDAAVCGTGQVCFHTYRVEARRLCRVGMDRVLFELTLDTRDGAELMDRVRIAVASSSGPGSAWRIDHSPAPTTAVRRS